VEFPHIQKLVEKYGAKGLVVVTLNTIPSDDATGLLLMSKKKYTFTNLDTPSSDWAPKNYAVQGSPTTVLLDQQGKVVLRHLGYSLEGVRGMDQAISYLLENGGGKKNK
jgi:thiol-disulfide isomerase/thioredoxin